jgi:hypothetical protein
MGLASFNRARRKVEAEKASALLLLAEDTQEQVVVEAGDVPEPIAEEPEDTQEPADNQKRRSKAQPESK